MGRKKKTKAEVQELKINQVPEKIPSSDKITIDFKNTKIEMTISANNITIKHPSYPPRYKHNLVDALEIAAEWDRLDKLKGKKVKWSELIRQTDESQNLFLMQIRSTIPNMRDKFSDMLKHE